CAQVTYGSSLYW
nr:immunoglobulin heavy chain junction region [Macaca mulatta]